MNEELKSHDCIIFYDSACPQCSWFIQYLGLGLGEDSSGVTVISLISKEAKDYYKRGEITVDPDVTDTMVVLNEGKQLLYWQAVRCCVKYSDLPGWLKKLFNLVPNVLGNQIYKVLSMVRSMTRKKDGVCKLPRS